MKKTYKRIPYFLIYYIVFFPIDFFLWIMIIIGEICDKTELEWQWLFNSIRYKKDYGNK